VIADPIGATRVVARVHSFEATKPITAGEGGMILTTSKAFAARIRALARPDYAIAAAGCPQPLTDLQAAMALAQWRQYRDFVGARATICRAYLTKLPAGLAVGKYRFQTHLAMEKCCTVPYRFVGYVPQVARLVNAAERRGIGIKQPVKPLCIHQLLGLDGRNYPGAESLIAQTVSLPLYPSLRPEAQAEVLELLLA
jgi:dTDP-4-amino-4,6-dideoxygalactose transaminase